MNEKYNGWTNYPTWAVNTWVSNEEGTYCYWCQEMADDAWSEAETPPQYMSRKEQAVRILSEWMKDEFEEANPLDDVNGIYSDLMSSALSDVNWHEIASHYIDDLETDSVDAE